MEINQQRIAMAVEFDGSEFHGWQRQENAGSVQAMLEQALARIEGQETPLVAAGRTDAGVHAEALLVHADVCRERWQRSPRAYTQGVNQLLPDSIRIVGVRDVRNDFHARFDCLERHYCYRIWNRSTASALERWRHWWMPRKLDEHAMHEAAQLLIGRLDFSAFRASGCQAANAVREVRHLYVSREGWEVSIDIHADAFLYHMVRNIVGSLVMVATGQWDADILSRVLEDGDRSQAAATAPARGLYFTNAVYEEFSAREIIGREISG